eukprot:jgi/Tetstr1/430962/TSEL_020717.t1
MTPPVRRLVAHRFVVQHTAFRARGDLEERANWDARDSCGPAPFVRFVRQKKPDALKVQRYLDDFKKVRSYITDLTVQWHFSPVERDSWKNLLDYLDEKQTAPSAAFSWFWPQRKEEVDNFLREHGQTAPA